MKLIQKIVVFTVFIILTNVLSTITSSRNGSDDPCHKDDCKDDHKDTYYQYVVITSIDSPESKRIKEQFEIKITIENQCNAPKEKTFQYVDLELTSVYGYITINESKKRITFMREGPENSREISWNVRASNVGNDSLSIDVHAYNSHEQCNKYDMDIFNISVEPLPPDIEINNLTYKPLEPVEGDIVTISTGIHNSGSDATWNLTYYSDDDIIKTIDVEIIEEEYKNLEIFWDTSDNAGNHTIKVEALSLPLEEDISDNSMKFDVKVKTRPDLTVNSLIFDTLKPVEGEVVNITSNIENLGETATNFSIICYIDDENNSIGMENLTLEGEEQNNLSFIWVTTDFVGKHIIWVKTDPQNIINESNENNNLDGLNITVSPPPEKPDPFLHPADISLPEPILEAENINITIVTRNLGNSSVNCTLNVSLIGAQVDIIKEIPIEFEALGVEEVYFFWNTDEKSGSWSIVVEITNTSLEENSTENNIAIKEFIIFERPELSIINLSWNPIYPIAGSNLKINATVKNDGGIGAFCSVQFRLNMNLSEISIYVPVKSIAVASTFLYIPDTSLLKVEINNITPWEWNNSNNLALATVEIFTYQAIYIDNLNISPQEPYQEELVDILVSVGNKGNLNGTADLSIFIDGNLFNTYYITLSPGVNETFKFEWEAIPGTHIFRAVLYLPVDDLGDNNESEVKVNVRHTPPNVSLLTIALSPSNPIEGEEIHIYVLIKNSGGTAADVTVALYIDNDLVSARMIHVEGKLKSTVSFVWITKNDNHIIEAKITALSPEGNVEEPSIIREIDIMAEEINQKENTNNVLIISIIIVTLVVFTTYLLKRRWVRD